jgi:H+/Cl- antiporter ClcA
VADPRTVESSIRRTVSGLLQLATGIVSASVPLALVVTVVVWFASRQRHLLTISSYAAGFALIFVPVLGLFLYLSWWLPQEVLPIIPGTLKNEPDDG